MSKKIDKHYLYDFCKPHTSASTERADVIERATAAGYYTPEE